MSIFSRRAIQRCIDENASFLTTEQIDRHVKLLNQCDRASIATEWEVILLRAFSNIGNLVHEGIFKGSSKPDLHMTGLRRELVDIADNKGPQENFEQQEHTLSNRDMNTPPSQSYEQEFIADITVVSDKMIEMDNPYDYFRDEFGRQAHKKKLTLGGFDFQVGGEATGKDYSNRKMMLLLPLRKEIPAFIKKHFGELITTVANNPNAPYSTEVVENGIDVTVKYNPRNREAVTGGHPSYNIAYSRTRNPLANALKDKAKQLRKTKFNGAKGIICCDGGCGIFVKRRGGELHYSHREIVEQFFRNNTSIGFVVLIWVADEGWVMTSDQRREIQFAVYSSAVADHKLSQTTYKLVQVAINLLPKPIRTAINAVRAVEFENENGGASFYGGWSMKGHQIKLSSRTLIDLLTGKIDQEQFFKDHGSDSFNVRNFFSKQVADGRMITDLSIESSEEQDDDWIVIRFGNPDPAISPFLGAKARGR